MKNFFIYIFLLISIFLYADSDFRNLKWGMPKEEVKKLETAEPLDIYNTSDTLKYKAILNDDNFDLNYVFFDNKLWCATYHSDYSEVTFKSYKESKKFFIKYKDLLSLKYGAYKLPNDNDDLIFMYNGEKINQNLNNNLDDFLKNDNKEKTEQKELNGQEEDNKFTDNGFYYGIKWETPATIIILSVENNGNRIYYIEKENYKKLNLNVKKAFDENKKKLLDGL